MVVAVGCGRPAHDPSLARSAAKLTGDSLRPHVDALVAIGPRPSHALEASRQAVAYITDQLVSYGFVTEHETFLGLPRVVGDQGPAEHTNVVAQVVGDSRPGEILEIAAPYDSAPGSVGARDNASGVAAVLEIARGLRGLELERSVRFCFFSMSEDGGLGSHAHAGHVRRLGERISGAIVLESIGYRTREPRSQKAPLRLPFLFSPPRRGDFVAVIGNLRSGGLGARIENVMGQYEPGLRYFSANRMGRLFGKGARGDQRSYWREGMRAILLTDTRALRPHAVPAIGDRPERLDFEFAASVARSTWITAVQWANEDE